MTTKRGLDWYQNVTGGQPTHYVTDGVEGYYTSAPGVTRREVAKAFAATSDHNDKPGYVVAEMAVCWPGDDGGTQYSDGVAFSTRTATSSGGRVGPATPSGIYAAEI